MTHDSSSTPLTVIAINGPINSGKSTVGAALSSLLPDAHFIDGDDSDDADAPADDLPLAEQWTLALERIRRWIETVASRYLIVAWPLRDADFAVLHAACERRAARLVVVTLAPPLDVARAERGGRVLTDWERQRIGEMYAEGYHARAFTDLIVDTAGLLPAQSAARIAGWLGEPR
jgi:cytidylate kinase